MGLLMRHWNSIAGKIAKKQPCAPLVSKRPPLAQPWADGFMRGVSQRFASWDQQLLQDENLNTFLGQILLLAVSEEAAAKEGVTPEKRAKMAGNLPLAVHGLTLSWREHTSKARRPDVRPAKAGRNGPCPCGSGTKYKKCCGGSAAAVH